MNPLPLEIRCVNPACHSHGEIKERDVYKDPSTGAWRFVNPMSEVCDDCGHQMVRDV